LPGRHRADPAQVLGEDQVGLDAGDQLLVQDVERLLPLHMLVDQVVGLSRAAGPVGGQGGVGYNRLGASLGRVVALERDP
jgi:hypothetical protein